MENRTQPGLTPGLDRLVNDARAQAVAEIRDRVQHFLREPDSADLVTLVTCDLCLLLDEVDRLQAIRLRHEDELSRLEQTVRAAGRSSPAPAIAPEQADAVGALDAGSAEPASVETLKSASERLEAALAARNWSACHAALESLRLGLGLDTERHSEAGPNRPPPLA